MRRSIKISAEMYSLLLERTLDGFSVIELRDEFVALKGANMDLGAARKIVYRQILRFLKQGWLRSEGNGRQKRYFQTHTFKALNVEAKSKNVDIEITSEHDYSMLTSELNQYKRDLEVVGGELEEYRSLNCRFPELEEKLTPLLDQTKERSAHLLGKVNALTHVLETLSEDSSIC